MNQGNQSGLRLLSLDGGGVGSISQLEVMRNVMQRIQYDTHPDDPDKVILPCEYFDLIGGSDTGGLLAILFTKLHMSVDEATEAFWQICEKVYDGDNMTAVERSAKLRECIEDLLASKQLPTDLKLSQNGSVGDTCACFVVATRKSNVSSKIKFRTYPVRNERNVDITVVDAVLATCASQPSFLPVPVGQRLRQQEYIGAEMGANNPCKEVIAETYGLFGGKRHVASLLSLGSAHPGPISLSHGSDYLHQLMTSCEEIAQDIDMQMGHLGIYHRFSVNQAIQRDEPKDYTEMGHILSLTEVYLEDAETSRKVDNCIESMRLRQGLASLEQLKHSGGAQPLYKGLPPLTTHFIMREEPWKKIIQLLVKNDTNSLGQKIMIISGMGGCGKTQLVTKFMVEFKERYRYAFFIDGSSKESIQIDLINHVRATSPAYSQAMFEDALAFFRNPNNQGWLLVYDNVDDIDLKLSPLLPDCTHGSIIVTTRNRSLGSFASDSALHLELDVMSEAEAVETITRSTKSLVSPENEKHIIAIAKELGYLPIALVQAGCYMFQTGCSETEYLSGLQKHKSKVMSIPSGDRQNQSTYAAFDISYRRLSPPVKNFLHLLSFFHFANFPMAVIPRAAKSLFTFDLFAFNEDSAQRHQAIQLLKETFCPEGHWDDMTLHTMCSILQNYSLVAFSRVATTRLLRIHPLIHEWAFDIIPQEQKALFWAASSRLIACANGEKQINFYLIPHIDALRSRLPHHPIALDDRAAFATIFYETMRLKDAQALWKDIYDTVSKDLGPSSLHVATAALYLAATYSGHFVEMERLEREALEIRESVLGKKHLETLRAKASLSGTLRRQGNMKVAEKLKEEIVDELTTQLGPNHPETRKALDWLASVYSCHGKFGKALPIKERLLAEQKEELGEDHIDTLTTMVSLAATYRAMKRYKEAETLQRAAIEGRKRQLGEEHPDTFNTLSQLASTYQRQKKLSEAEELLNQVLDGKKRIFGSEHLQTLEAMSDLGEIYHSQGRHLDAEELRKQVLEGRRKLLGDNDFYIALAMYHLASTYVAVGRLKDANRLALKAEDIWSKTSGMSQYRGKNAALLRQLGTQATSQSRHHE
ncbi:hypothetical protein CPB86DRAFT_765176 [Serendipita vermifera]|nr:hypothetical protein CPB86DRAFT_765176 [Serendipita vermifera]